MPDLHLPGRPVAPAWALTKAYWLYQSPDSSQICVRDADFLALAIFNWAIAISDCL